ncbi:probable RNA-binding protein ARP1 [Oryza brachyantha]|uniref:RRM domain-containing protein n=1 Tax=Oryza brachyantha TaxID=4533 RepID=J3LH80_ORYBR|nr:probable RNA-binding protein ARP1 [Oryza brachyantha]
MAAASSSAGGSSPAAHATAGGGGIPNHRTRFGDTTLTKVFVGGLAWETPSKGLHDHFQRYGEILEAVVIADRETGRSKGYGFVTFRDPESAQEAVLNPNPTIGGRRANCNIASQGPPRPSSSPSRGRAPRGSHFPDQPHIGPHPYMGGRMPPQQMTAPPQPMYYHPQYWYPSDYSYQHPYQQAVYNSQVLPHYYPQLYGPNSPSTPSYQLMGYMPGGPGPRTGYSPMQQAARPPFVQQPTAQFEGSFPPGPSLPPNFRLQLPPHAVSRQPDDTAGAQSAPPVSASAAPTPTTTDNQEASKTVGPN